ncbi:MFS general substrate transporter [Melanomma pulvis-pyrius CBS 109.77]|uniref:MFS general substrate transporter n=1 Tax=Melanomma pulvis-pyrius CBS 109.77 TaxID=1314802 RepID=A0A6A6X1I5_9PLEO|nr:MFS general substrate transporter [Melanomma pulvis-pyrius CBS 109.77]
MRNPFKHSGTLDAPVAVEYGNEHGVKNIEKAVEAGHPPVVDVTHPVDSDSEKFSADAQDGVKKMQATTTVWSKNHLITAYVLMWIITFIDALQQGTTGVLTPYVTSSFYEHSLTAYTGIMANIIGGVLKLPLAKVLDIFGRPQGFALTTFFLVLGLIMMAACDGVQTYSAAQIFYWVGYNGMSYTLGIFTSDTSSLRNRGFMFAFVSSPYIITVWCTGPLATAFLEGPGWRWCYGAFSIITLVVCLPLWALFQYNYRKAVKSGIIVPVKSNRTFSESVKYYSVEFDVVGLFLLMGGLVFFLLPFSLYSYQDGLWKSPLVVSFLIIGGLLLIGFTLYEKYVAPKTFIPFELLMDRTVMGACILSGIVFVSWYIWNSYFSSFIQVVNGLNVTQTSYIINIYSIGSCFFSLIVGLLIRWTGRFKWLALFFGAPVTMLGVGLLIHFRQPDVNVGYIVMCQIFIAFSGGTIVICEQIAALAATDHQHIAVVLAIEGMFTAIGGGIGGSIAAAVWTGVFPERLYRYMPAENQADVPAIYASLVTQLSYPKGTAARAAIEHAYGDAQRYMCIGATCILTLMFPAILVWRDIRVKEFKQVKGVVA